MLTARFFALFIFLALASTSWAGGDTNQPTKNTQSPEEINTTTQKANATFPPPPLIEQIQSTHPQPKPQQPNVTEHKKESEKGMEAYNTSGQPTEAIPDYPHLNRLFGKETVFVHFIGH
jgi:hypothetical protein